jgi:predicted ribosome quality control (RQC) complex YloA/Tae2 family protein
MGFERIIKMELGNSSERFYMFIRLWSAASNIIVTDSDYYILDVFSVGQKKMK